MIVYPKVILFRSLALSLLLVKVRVFLKYIHGEYR